MSSAASNTVIRELIAPRVGKQITLINRIGDENRVQLEAVGDTSCIVKYAWGTKVEVHYQDSNYDFKL